MSKCLRCGRDLKDPNGLLGWRCAEALSILDVESLTDDDIDKLVDWYLQNGESLSTIGDILAGSSFFSKSTSLLEHQNIEIRSKTINPKNASPFVRHSLFDKETNTRLFELDDHGFNTKFGRTPPTPHLNVKSKSKANLMQTKIANSLDHQKIPRPVYNAFKNFDDVGKVVKTEAKHSLSLVQP